MKMVKNGLRIITKMENPMVFMFGGIQTEIKCLRNIIKTEKKLRRRVNQEFAKTDQKMVGK